MADKSKLGYEFPSRCIEVEKGKIAEFAMAVAQKDSPEKINFLYTDETAAKRAGYPGIILPPTFTTHLMLRTCGGFRAIVNALGIDANRLLHSEEEYEYFNPVCAGDIITGKMKVVDMYNKERQGSPGKFIEVTVLETEMRNQKGKLVIKTRSTLLEL
ncbi:MAG: MaoC family dehydratase N-terminal domain-containing protein [Smithella sp.]